MLTSDLLRFAVSGNLPPIVQTKNQLYLSIVLQRPPERAERPYAYHATNDAMPGGDESFLGEHVQFERVLCSVSVVFHSAGRQDRPPAQAESSRPDGQHRRFEPDLL